MDIISTLCNGSWLIDLNLIYNFKSSQMTLQSSNEDETFKWTYVVNYIEWIEMVSALRITVYIFLNYLNYILCKRFIM